MIGLLLCAGDKMTSGVHVDDAARAYVIALKYAPAGSVYNIVTSEDTSFRSGPKAYKPPLLDLPVIATPPHSRNSKTKRFLIQFTASSHSVTAGRMLSDTGSCHLQENG